MCMADLLSFIFIKISVDDVSKIFDFFLYLCEGERSKSNDVMFADIQIHIMFSSKQTILDRIVECGVALKNIYQLFGFHYLFIEK